MFALGLRVSSPDPFFMCGGCSVTQFCYGARILNQPTTKVLNTPNGRGRERHSIPHGTSLSLFLAQVTGTITWVTVFNSVEDFSSSICWHIHTTKSLFHINGELNFLVSHTHPFNLKVQGFWNLHTTPFQDLVVTSKLLSLTFGITHPTFRAACPYTCQSHKPSWSVHSHWKESDPRPISAKSSCQKTGVIFATQLKITVPWFELTSWDWLFARNHLIGILLTQAQMVTIKWRKQPPH